MAIRQALEEEGRRNPLMKFRERAALRRYF
jgi:hypothetical protein